jgi:hypothetical protein
VTIVRIPFPRSLLALTVLVSSPLLGGGGCAQAGYIAPVALVQCPHADFTTDSDSQTSRDDLGATGTASEPSDEIDWDRNDRNGVLPLPRESYSPDLNANPSSTGAGSQAPSGAGGSNQPPALASPLQTAMPVLIGALFLVTVSRRPPPFPSRLFRPPR